MRHLNKIVFLNSANIPYAEVMLDGNVHFAGTQGVGKSTVLRALLFFYNADKMHLGIQSGQKSFEEFYFKHSNSYIIYEVKTDHSAYTIFVFRSQGKIAYRFIDAPYQRDWFVNSDNSVEYDWSKIRGNIGVNIDISLKIDTYERYRDIIFGNAHDHKFDKYAIVESSKYQNIPRSIQNVFLNSKLDADFVKNTIIQSMSDNEDSINLANYRHWLVDFEKEFDDIECWYKKDSNGEIPVRTKAHKVIEIHRNMLALDYEIKQTWHQLNYAVSESQDQIPFIEEKINKLKVDIQKIKEKNAEANAEYQKEHDQLTGKIAILNEDLKRIKEKQKYYDSKDIKSIIELDSKEPSLQLEKSQKDEHLRKLQEQYKDVTEKYKSLYKSLEDELKTFVFSIEEEIQKKRNETMNQQVVYRAQCDKRLKSLNDAHNEWVTSSDERISVLIEEKNHAEIRLSELRYWHPMSEQIQDCESAIHDLRKQENEIKSNLAIIIKDIDVMRKEGELKCERIEAEYKQKQESCQSVTKEIEHSINEITNLLSRWEGSLYEWLVNNKTDWEDTIGKIVDEDRVLYAQGLEPQIAEDSDSVFGVKLNLDSLQSHHRSPDEYRALLKEQNDNLAAKKKEINELLLNYQNDLGSVKKSYKAKISELKQQQTTIDFSLKQIPVKIKDEETKIRQFENQEKEMVDAEKAKRQADFNTAVLNLEKEKEVRDKQKQKHDKSVKDVEADFKAETKKLQNEFDGFREKQSHAKETKQQDIDKRRAVIEHQEHDELTGAGADTKAIDLCKKDIEKVMEILAKIAEQRHLVIGYRNDVEELFSHEEEYREEKRQFETRDKQLFQTYEDKKRIYNEKLAGFYDDLKQQEKSLNEKNEGLRQYRQMCDVENLVPKELVDDETKKCCKTQVVELVSIMRGDINKKNQKFGDLKVAINKLNTHFSANNSFHFISPQYDADFIDFAVNLDEFIENDKIEEFRKRVSDHYNGIMRNVSREVGRLMNHSAEIKGIINDVNRDFKERNFAGVIRSIELRAEEPSDRMIQLLRSIRDFTEENQFSMGEVNLFSGNESDKINEKVIEHLKNFMEQLRKEPSRTELTLSDTFRLQFRILENDNDTGWVERINNVGSDGTDILVKAMVNIMLINVFKTKASRKNGDFIIHCMMDEIGKLHPSNVNGILQFANVRNIYLINSSPMGYNADIYKYNYMLTKDSKSQTHIKRLMTINA